MKNMSSQSLIDAFMKGDKKAFSQLVKEHQTYCLYKAQKIVRDPELAKDLVQESFIQAYNNLDKLRDRNAFKGWMSGIVRNVCNNFLRRNKHYTSPIEDHQLEQIDEENGYSKVEHQDYQQQITEALDTLPKQQRQLIDDFYYHDLSVREIARLRHLSESNVKIRLFRARKQLRKLMGATAFVYARNINHAFTYDPDYLIQLLEPYSCYSLCNEECMI